MPFRTDLALEALELTERSGRRLSEQQGVSREVSEIEGFEVTRVHIRNEEGAKAVGKPRGSYDTLDLGALIRRENDSFPRACTALSGLLAELLRDTGDGPALIVGLGNRSITPDAVGPLACEHVIATRHLVEQTPEYFSSWRQVAAVAPGVLGQTGVETGEIVQGVMDRIKPAAVVAIDALAAGRLSRLLHTIQLSDTGIIPGSGVGNARFALNRDTLGVPVIAIGVPTVVDGATLASEITDQTGIVHCEALDDLSTPVVVTTRDIDREVRDVSRVIGYAVNKALHPHLSIEDIDLFLS